MRTNNYLKAENLTGSDDALCGTLIYLTSSASPQPSPPMVIRWATYTVMHTKTVNNLKQLNVRQKNVLNSNYIIESVAPANDH